MKLPTDVSESIKRRNPTLYPDSAGGVSATDQKPTKGHPLVSAGNGKAKGVLGVKRRARIRFTVHARRPADWDGWHVKELQDVLVEAGLLDGDEWDILEGSVRSEKVYKAWQEKTVIDIEFV